MARYEEQPQLAGYVLEESWVLAVDEADGNVSFTLEAALAQEHPQYRPTRDGEVNSYERVRLIFVSPRDIVWLSRGSSPATDASGEPDWGHIDTYTYDGAVHELSGDWGAVRITGTAPTVTPLASA